REGAGLGLCCPDELLPGTGSIDTERSRIGIYFRLPEAFLCDPGHIGLRGPRPPAGPAPLRPRLFGTVFDDREGSGTATSTRSFGIMDRRGCRAACGDWGGAWGWRDRPRTPTRLRGDVG